MGADACCTAPWGSRCYWGYRYSYPNVGHNRLSIIDLSASADQPFVYKKVTIVFSGEVYSYLELRDILQTQGYKFNITGDTEIVCAAYQHWGKEC